MGSRTNRAIDYSIDKKLKAGLITKSSKKRLLKSTGFYTLKKYNTVKSVGLIDDILDSKDYIGEKDLYDNEVCNFLNYKLTKTQNRFNLLRLFKPGEILNAVARSY